RVTVIAGLCKCSVGVGTQHDGVRAVDADEPQLTEGLGDGFRILADIGGEGQSGVAGSLTNADDAGRGIALEYGAIFGEGELARGVLGGLPVGVVGATIHVVDGLAVEVEGNAQLHEGLHFALPGEDAVLGRRNLLQVAGADGGEGRACGTLNVDDAAPGEVAMQIIHGRFLLLGNRYLANHRAGTAGMERVRALWGRGKAGPLKAGRRRRRPEMLRMARRTGFR